MTTTPQETIKTPIDVARYWVEEVKLAEQRRRLLHTPRDPRDDAYRIREFVQYTRHVCQHPEWLPLDEMVATGNPEQDEQTLGLLLDILTEAFKPIPVEKEREPDFQPSESFLAELDEALGVSSDSEEVEQRLRLRAIEELQELGSYKKTDPFAIGSDVVQGEIRQTDTNAIEEDDGSLRHMPSSFDELRHFLRELSDALDTAESVVDRLQVRLLIGEIASRS